MDRFKSSQAIPGSEVLIPGEPERKMQNERLQNGIPIGSKVWEDLMNISKELNVKL
jgi:LDH2 family malate/lactate/ureidoglycolate dehydrogenase